MFLVVVLGCCCLRFIFEVRQEKGWGDLKPWCERIRSELKEPKRGSVCRILWFLEIF